MMNDKALRAQLVKLLDFEEAHVGFDRAVKGIPPRLRGMVPTGGEHSLWQLVEHLRIAQADILEFCRHREVQREEVAGRLLAEVAGAAQRGGLDAGRSPRYRRDRKALQRLAANPKIDLFATIPHGTGQTYLREILLVADSQRVSHRPDRRRCGSSSASGSSCPDDDRTQRPLRPQSRNYQRACTYAAQGFQACRPQHAALTASAKAPASLAEALRAKAEGLPYDRPAIYLKSGDRAQPKKGSLRAQ